MGAYLVLLTVLVLTQGVEIRKPLPDYGNKTTSNSATLVHLPPEFRHQPSWPQSSYYDEFGPPISVSCDLVPNNNDTLLWFRNGVTLKQTSTLVTRNFNQTLRFTYPEQNQTGSYTCLAYNNQGNISYTGYIYIAARKQETRPRIVLTNPGNLIKHARVGDNVTIGCTFDIGGSSTGLLDFNMNWHKENQSVDDTNHTTWGLNQTSSNDQILSLTIYSFNVSDYGAYRCIGVNHLGNDSRVVLVVPPHNSKEKLPIPLIVVGCASAAVVVIILILSAKLYRSRRNRKYETLDWEEPDIQKYDVPNYVVKFDVFVSYSHEDLSWVKDILFKTLSDRSYEVCLDFKDFIPGMATSANIMDAIYTSRKTIVLMSKHFLKSTWGQFELQQAHYRAIAQRKDVLILVKVDDCKVPAKLMGKTFLDWTDDKVRPHFWDRLFEALGEPGNFNSDERLLTDITQEPDKQDGRKPEGDSKEQISSLGISENFDQPLLNLEIQNEDEHIDNNNRQLIMEI